jgi:hypothetical protein
MIAAAMPTELAPPPVIDRQAKMIARTERIVIDLPPDARDADGHEAIRRELAGR